MLSNDYFENTLRHHGHRMIAGVDEVGRGALAGPVLAAAVVLDPVRDYPEFRDSKVLSPAKRRFLAERIHGEALGVGFGWVPETEIDRINILQATRKAMLQAVANLPVSPDIVMVDGYVLGGLSMPCIGIIHGDSRSFTIAAASIVAKVSRDAFMTGLASTYPQYAFDSNMGYGTEFHRRAIAAHGPSPCHRRTFHGVCAVGGNDGQ